MSEKSIYFLVIVIFMGGCSSSESTVPLNSNREKTQNTIELELNTGINSKRINDTLFVYLTRKWDELGLDADQRMAFFDCLKGNIEEQVLKRKRALYTLHEKFKDYQQSLLIVFFSHFL